MEYKLVKDYGDHPVEVFDGLEPDKLILSPSSCGLDASYCSIDLVAEIANKYKKDPTGNQYRTLYQAIPHRIMALNKSSNRKESLSGYLAVTPKVDGSKRRIVLFSFFEVSPLRYHCYIHRVYEEIGTAR